LKKGNSSSESIGGGEKGGESETRTKKTEWDKKKGGAKMRKEWLENKKTKVIRQLVKHCLGGGRTQKNDLPSKKERGRVHPGGVAEVTDKKGKHINLMISDQGQRVPGRKKKNYLRGEGGWRATLFLKGAAVT